MVLKSKPFSESSLIRYLYFFIQSFFALAKNYICNHTPRYVVLRKSFTRFTTIHYRHPSGKCLFWHKDCFNCAIFADARPSALCYISAPLKVQL
ncbi:hypothetical protein BMETH_470_1 [methanotrophic bacterial endosymbiont of Bathymodiolus sp.]|nr:hypothetical protein BMETH_470_1 [methanotrophic bacterial endosymbiont of Bathymodiolus sp.]